MINQTDILNLNYQYPHPGVYGIKEINIKDNLDYQLVYKYANFDVPEKMYGDTMSNIIRIWNRYAITGSTVGSIFAGDPGTGKTLSCMALCNIALQHNIPVIMCTEVNFTIELVYRLSMLTDCVLFMDEFKKNVRYDVEDKMLSMLSEPKNTRKLIIITENEAGRISQYIINRPQRARYLLEFNKISKSVLEDYLNDYNVTGEFRSNIVNCYKEATSFSFDNLQAIVSEHINYPEDDFDSVINRLNVPSLRIPVRIMVDRVEVNGEPADFKSISKPILKEYKYDDYIYIRVEVSIRPKEGDVKSENTYVPPIGNFNICFKELSMEGFDNIYTYKASSGDNEVKVWLVAKPMR